MANVQHNSLTGADLHVAGPVTTQLSVTDQASDPASPAAGGIYVYSKSGGLYYKAPSGTVTGPLTDSASVKGLPLALTGATAATRYVGGTASGAPASGTFAKGDFNIGQDGSVWICTAAGSPGTWTQVSGGGGVPIWQQIWEAFDSNTDPIDTIITSGAYVVFIFFSSQNAASWKSPTNARHTVAAGKTLIILQAFMAQYEEADKADRAWRLYDSTAAATVIGSADYDITAASGIPTNSNGGFPWRGDAATASQLPTVAAAHAVELDLWNKDTTKRAGGALVICREI